MAQWVKDAATIFAEQEPIDGKCEGGTQTMMSAATDEEWNEKYGTDPLRPIKDLPVEIKKMGGLCPGGYLIDATQVEKLLEHPRTKEKWRLHYFELRARGEPVRLALAYCGIEYEEVPIDYAEMKKLAGTQQFPFGQGPVLEDNGFFLSQMDAIMRYIARKHAIYGRDSREQGSIDMVLSGVEDLRQKYTTLCYDHKFDAGKLKEYTEMHVEPASAAGMTKNGGAHFAYLAAILARNLEIPAHQKTGFVVGRKLSIADLALYDLVDLHLRPAACPAALKAGFKSLVQHHAMIGELPAIKAYLDSPGRHLQINGNNMG